MKNIIVFTFFILFSAKGYSQKSVSKSLFFYEDSVFFVGCGGIKVVDILYFVSDTSSKKNNLGDYYIAVACADGYGNGFFKKGSKYSLVINRDYKSIKSYLSPRVFKQFYKTKKLYVLQKIRRI